MYEGGLLFAAQSVELCAQPIKLLVFTMGNLPTAI
jgi:hypothetical protein